MIRRRRPPRGTTVALAALPLLATLLLPTPALATTTASAAWTSTWVSRPKPGAPPATRPGRPSISGDGQTVAFKAFSKLDKNGAPWPDRQARAFVLPAGSASPKRLALAADGSQGDGPDDFEIGFDHTLSSDGKAAVLVSRSTNLTPATPVDGAGYQVFLRDLTTGAVRLVSHAPDGGPADAYSGKARISGDGASVLYQSLASNLTTRPANGLFTWYLYDVATDTSTRLAIPVWGNPPQLTGDGKHVLFSTTRRLSPADGNGTPDVYLLDVATGGVSLVGVSESGRPLHGNLSSISDDGTTIAFVPYSPVGTGTFYVRNLTTGHTTATRPAGAVVDDVKISGDGSRVAAVLEWGLSRRTVRVSDLAGRVVYRSHPDHGTELRMGVSIDDRGACVAFTTDYPEAAADTNGSDDVYRACQP